MNLEKLQQILFQYEDKIMRDGVLVGVATESMLAINLNCTKYLDSGREKIRINVDIETSGMPVLEEEIAEAIADTTRDYLKSNEFFQEAGLIDINENDIDWFTASYSHC